MISGIEQRGTPLKILLATAAVRGSVAEVQAALTAGADVNKLVRLHAEEQRTALHLAAQYKHASVVELLLAQPGIDVNAIGEDEKTPLHTAVTAGDLDCINLLLAAEHIKVNSRDHLGITPLARAALNGDPEIVQALISANIKQQPLQSKDYLVKPLANAVLNKHLAAARLLLAAGADWRIPTKHGTSVLFRAHELEDQNMIALLMSYGATLSDVDHKMLEEVKRFKKEYPKAYPPADKDMEIAFNKLGIAKSDDSILIGFKRLNMTSEELSDGGEEKERTSKIARPQI